MCKVTNFTKIKRQIITITNIKILIFYHIGVLLDFARGENEYATPALEKL
jgi:hypothetical protein